MPGPATSASRPTGEARGGLPPIVFRVMEVFKLPPPEREGDHVWYFSYGSNMKSEVFCKRRGIVAQQIVRCQLPGYVLSYALDGLPFLEPAFATCVKREQSIEADARPDIHGVAFRITETELKRVLATEGGCGWHDGSVGGYRLSSVRAIDYDGNCLDVWTLTNERCDIQRPGASHNCPSQRYKGLVVDGAKEVGLDSKYITWLEQQPAYTGAGLGWKFTVAKLLVMILIGLPSMVQFMIANPLIMRASGNWRPPWLVTKCFRLYNTAAKFFVLPLLALFAGSGYHNDDEERATRTKKTKDV